MQNTSGDINKDKTNKHGLNYDNIRVNTVINLDELNEQGKKKESNETREPLKEELAPLNFQLKSAFSVADVKYSEECRCGPSEVVEISFEDHQKAIIKNSKKLNLKLFEYVIVEQEGGLECATVIACGDEAKENLKHCYNNVLPELEVARKATVEDLKKVESNKNDEFRIIAKAKQLIEKHKLDMKVTAASWQFDRHKLTIYFTAPQRIDFRELVKDLAHVFKTRIELRQISSREEARRIGGMGPCGLTICCASFGTDRCHVTLDHARHQQLSTNVSKLSGYCGRLKCCLLYEHDVYVEILKDFPPLNSIVETDEGKAVLNKIDVFKESATLFFPDTGAYKTVSGDIIKKLAADGKVEYPKTELNKKKNIPYEEEVSEFKSDY